MDLIRHYFPELTETQLDRFSKLSPLYAEWNSKINVISRKDIDELYVRHVLHSLSIGKFVQFLPGKKVLDLGTGGGFPGIPLAILFPETEFLLVDSIGKKIKVVQAVADSLNLTNVRASHCRVEELIGKFDYVTARAVTKLDRLWQWTEALLRGSPVSNSGLYALKGAGLEEEIRDFTTAFPKVLVKEWLLSDFFAEPYFQEKALIRLQFG